jgi:uncharacterized membrane protein YeaQ/YmgE (transglycosylase-associated protein family)
MSIIWMLLVGLIVGAIAKLLMPGRDPGGFVVTMILGVLGSILGGFLLGLILPGRGMGAAGLIGSVLGAMLLLWIYRLLVAKRGI